MQFAEYSSIKSHKINSHVSKVRRMFGDKDFVVMEKIHGANFQFMCQIRWNDDSISTIDVKCGKRTAFLNDDEKFYGWQTVRDRYLSEIETLCREMCGTDTSIDRIIVFGELFGGGYPGVKSINKPVQQGIYYCPDLDFLVFDIAIHRQSKLTQAKLTFGREDSDCVSDEQNSTVKQAPVFVSYSEAAEYLSKHKILKIVPMRFRGKFDDALNFAESNQEFITLIPRMYGLNDLPNNFAEGNVLKADVQTIMGEHRGIMKIKHPRFDEIVGFVPNKIKSGAGEDAILQHHKEQLKCFLTQNRLDAVISKYGPSTIRAKLIGCFLNDAKEDYLKTLELDVEELIAFNKLWKNLFKTLISHCEVFSYP